MFIELNPKMDVKSAYKYELIKKQQLKLDLEQKTGSKLGKESIKAVYCHPAYLTYMWNTS